MQLLSDLEAALYSHQVKVVSPLEMAPSGKKLRNMVTCMQNRYAVYTPALEIVCMPLQVAKC